MKQSKIFQYRHGYYFCPVEDKIYWLTATGDLTGTKLDNQESRLFEFLLNNPNQILSKRTLEILWPTGHVTHNSIERCVSRLRKRLRDADCSDVLLKTVPRQGYVFTGEVMIIDSFPDHAAEKDDIKQSPEPVSHKARYFLAAGIALVFLFVFDSYSTKVSIDPFKHPITIFSEDTKKVFPSISSDGERIMYSANKESSPHWFLEIQNLHGGVKDQVSFPDKSVFAPDWVNHNEVVFYLWSPNECEIALYQLDTKSLRTLTNCNQKSINRSLKVANNGLVYYSDMADGINQTQVHSIDIASSHKRVYDIGGDDAGGMGVLFVGVSPNNKYLAVIANREKRTSEISVYLSDDLSQPVWQFTQEQLLASAAIFNEHLVHRDTKGNFRIIDFEQNIVVAEVPSTELIYFPVAGPDGFAFLAGEFFRQNLWLTDLTTGETVELTRDKHTRNFLPITCGDNVYFISTRTGLQQLWKKTKSGMEVQMSNFHHSKFIYSFDVSEDRQMAALSTDLGIEIYRIENGKLSNRVTTVDGLNPYFVRDGLLHAKFDGKIQNLYLMDIYDLALKQISFNGAWVSREDNDEIYFTKSLKPGVWQLLENGEEVQVYKGSWLQSSRHWDVDNGWLYVRKPGEEQTTRINLSTFEEQILSGKECEMIDRVEDNQCLSTKTEFAANKLLYKKLF